MIVLLLDVSHLNLEAIGNSPIDPPSGLPLQILLNACNLCLSSVRSACLKNARILSSSNSNFVCKNFSPWQYRITPTFRNSSLSTLGMNRITAYSNKCFSCMLGFFHNGCRYGNSCQQKIFVYASAFCCCFIACFIKQPFIRN